MTLLLLPVVAGAILGVTLVWWSVSWLAEGIRQLGETIRTAN